MLLLCQIDSNFPSTLQYYMDDMIVSEISMQAFEPFTMVPGNVTSSTHRFSIKPPLPSGLSIDSHLGVIQGSANEGLDKVVFTVSLYGYHHAVNCTLVMVFLLNTHMDLFHGTIDGPTRAIYYRSTNMSPSPPEWEQLPVSSKGEFSFSVLYTTFQLLYDFQAFVFSLVFIH